MNKKIAVLIMVDSVIVEEKYLEYASRQTDTSSPGEEVTEAQWFFY